MESETLVDIVISTKYGIDIWSSKIIDQYNFYTQTLRESGIDIVIKYNDGDVDIFNINDLLDVMNETPDHTHYFLELYGREFNSCDKYKIFDMIEEAYKTKYGYTISEGPIFQKYNELFRKIKIVEKQLMDIWKQLNEKSRVVVSQYSFDKTIRECYDLILEPHKNESEIIESLESVMSGYRQVQMDEHMERQREMEMERLKEEMEMKKDLTIKKNKFGQFIYEKYNLVLDPKDKCIVGVSNKMGGFYPLDLSAVQLCQKLKLKYKVINDQRTF